MSIRYIATSGFFHHGWQTISPAQTFSEGNILIRMQLSYTIVTLNIFFFGYPFPQYPVWLPLSAFVTLLLNILQWNCFLNFSLPCMQNILFGHPFLILLPSSNIVNISFDHGGQMGYFLFFYPRDKYPIWLPLSKFFLNITLFVPRIPYTWDF